MVPPGYLDFVTKYLKDGDLVPQIMHDDVNRFGRNTKFNQLKISTLKLAYVYVIKPMYTYTISNYSCCSLVAPEMDRLAKRGLKLAAFDYNDYNDYDDVIITHFRHCIMFRLFFFAKN